MDHQEGRKNNRIIGNIHKTAQRNGTPDGSDLHKMTLLSKTGYLVLYKCKLIL